MDRKPPRPVRRLLRQEVGFACPIPDCSEPVLTWHHFDPPWREKHHHNPQGMIALCPQHHPVAEGENWTRKELRSFKKKDPDLSLVRKRFMWAEQSVLYRLGGSYAANCGGILGLSGVPLLWDRKSPEGRLLFSLSLCNQDNRQVAFIEENSLSVDALSIHDLTINTHENRLKIWFRERKIGLELRMRHRTIDQLARDVESDTALALRKFAAMFEDIGVSDNSSGIRDSVVDYANERCLNDDGKVPVLDIMNASLYAHGRKLVIRTGAVAKPGGAAFGCFSYDNGGFAFGF